MERVNCIVEIDGRQNTMQALKLHHKYAKSMKIRSYEKELQQWIEKSWLIPYDEQKFGPLKGPFLLMDVVQQNKYRVHPVMHYWERNEHVDAYMANTDVCMQKLRVWRQEGSNVTCTGPIRKSILRNLCSLSKQRKLKDRGTALPVLGLDLMWPH